MNFDENYFKRLDEELNTKAIKPADKNNDSNLPDGQYNVRILAIEPFWTKNNAPCLKWQLEIITGKYAGGKLQRFSMMKTQENIRYLKGDFETLGLPFGSLVELHGILPRAVGLAMKLRKKTSPGTGGNSVAKYYIDEKIEREKNSCPY